MLRDCLDEETAAALLDGKLAAAEVERIEAHADGCSACRAFLSALAAARSQPPLASPIGPTEPGAPSPIAPVPLFTRGDAIGRYVVLDRVGVGGMGVVYSAYDPELDRRVAVKLLRRRRDELGVARARLLREAQALARLIHPNVVVVHDIGTWDEQVFLAMEFVDGGTITQWLTAAARPLGEVLRVYLQAGRGLAAAHRAGLVHRDFKPDNVLVGRDDRVLVTDFGLARAPGRSGDDDREYSPAVPHDPLLTQAGAVLGTPGYMAPEQDAGQFTNAKSDQFSFCVALYEGLCGARPGQDPFELAASRGVPARIRAILQRGLSPNPDARYPSMDALLDELAIDASARRRRAFIAAGMVLALVAAVAVPAQLGRRRSRPCAGGDDRFAQAWSSARQTRIHDALITLNRSRGTAVWSSLAALVERYRRDWVGMYSDACSATHVRGEQSEDALQLRMECLSDRLDEVSALAALWERADPLHFDSLIEWGAALTPVAGCADLVALTAPVRPPDAATRTRVDALRKRGNELMALIDAGYYAELKKSVAPLIAEVHAIGYPPLEASLRLVLGGAEARLDERALAEADLTEAALESEAAHADDKAAIAWSELLNLLGNDEGRATEAHRVARLADAAVRRLRGRRRDIEAIYWDGVSGLSAREGRNQDALDEERRVLELREAYFGPDHVETALALGNVAVSLLALHRYAEALPLEERAMHIQETIFPPDHPILGDAHYNLCIVLMGAGRFDEAREHCRRSLTIAESRLGPDHPDNAWPLVGLSQVAFQQQHYDESVLNLRRALAIRLRALGPDHADVAEARGRLAETLLEMGRPADALTEAERARSIAEKVAPRTTYMVSWLTHIGRAQLALGAPRKALPTLEAALALAKELRLTETQRSSSEWALAEVLWETGDRRRARLLAEAAYAGFSTDMTLSRREAERAAAWLAAH